MPSLSGGHDSQVQIGIVLLGWALGTITLGVGLSDAHSQVVLGAVAVEAPNPLQLLALQRALEREQRVGPDLLDQRDHRPARCRDRFDELGSGQQILSAARDAVVGADVFASVRILGNHQLAVGRIVGELEVDRGMVHRHPELGLGQHVRDASAPVVDLASVLKRGPVLIARAKHEPAM